MMIPALHGLITWFDVTSPQGPRVHLPVTYFLFRDTTFHLVLALSSSLRPKYGTPHLFTSANPKHTLPSDVILRHTTFFQPISPPSGPCNAPWFSSETLMLYKSLTYLLTENIGLTQQIYRTYFYISTRILLLLLAIYHYIKTVDKWGVKKIEVKCKGNIPRTYTNIYEWKYTIKN